MDEIPLSGSNGQLARVRELLRQGDLASADAIVNERLARIAGDAEALYMRALIAARRRDYRAAIASLQQAVAIEPESSLAWLALGNAHARSDEFAAAADAYRSRLELSRVEGGVPAWRCRRSARCPCVARQLRRCRLGALCEPVLRETRRGSHRAEAFVVIRRYPRYGGAGARAPSLLVSRNLDRVDSSGNAEPRNFKKLAEVIPAFSQH